MMLVLHYYQGFSVREVADIVDAREGTVRVALHRALRHLRSQLQSTIPTETAFSPAGEPLAAQKE
jgi:DNA-directed RNA polymerase specialized sigma24 family protein